MPSKIATKKTSPKKPRKKKPTGPVADGIPIYCSYDEVAPISKIIPNPRNPNNHPQYQIDLLVKLIQGHGWRVPITISTRSGMIVRGHGRLRAAQQAGLKEVPIDLQDYPDEETEIADLIADNRIAELAEIDQQMIRDLLQELDTGNLDMDLTGYTQSVIEYMMTSSGPPPNAEEEWGGMPECNSEDQSAYKRIIIHFRDEASVQDFAKRLGQVVGKQTRSMWHPILERMKMDTHYIAKQ